MNEVEALVQAARLGDEVRVRELLRANPSLAAGRMPSGESPVMEALYRGHRDLARTLVELGAEPDIFSAAALGMVERLGTAIERSGSIDAPAYDGWTPLHLAAFFGHLDAARMLLDAGADPRSVSRNGMKNTPLHAAAAGRHEDVALLLLARGADPHAADAGGYTPASIAAENGLSKVLLALT